MAGALGGPRPDRLRSGFRHLSALSTGVGRRCRGGVRHSKAGARRSDAMPSVRIRSMVRRCLEPRGLDPGDGVANTLVDRFRGHGWSAGRELGEACIKVFGPSERCVGEMRCVVHEVNIGAFGLPCHDFADRSRQTPLALHPNPPPWRCRCQHRWADAPCSACGVEGRGLHREFPREGQRRTADPARVAAVVERSRTRQCSAGSTGRRADPRAPRQGIAPLPRRACPDPRAALKRRVRGRGSHTSAEDALGQAARAW
jgi:hypothetical protein